MFRDMQSLNSGSLFYQSGSTVVSASCVFGYGFFYGYTAIESGFTEHANQISVFVPQTSSLSVIRPNMNVDLIGNDMSGSFRVVSMNNTNPLFVWLTVANRPDVRVQR